MTPDEIAAVEKLTASLNEFAAIVRRIDADLALLDAIAKTATDGVAK